MIKKISILWYVAIIFSLISVCFFVPFNISFDLRLVVMVYILLFIPISYNIFQNLVLVYFISKEGGLNQKSFIFKVIYINSFSILLCVAFFVLGLVNISLKLLLFSLFLYSLNIVIRKKSNLFIFTNYKLIFNLTNLYITEVKNEENTAKK